MHSEFSDEFDDFILISLDDMLIYSDSQDLNEDYICYTLSKICTNNLSTKKKNRNFSVTKAKYLSHIIGNRQLCCDTSKTSAITTWPVPSNTKEIQQFMGFCKLLIPLHQVL